MKKQMLIIKGESNSGKSTVVKLALEMFLQWAIQKKKASTVHYLYLTGREVAAIIEIGDDCIGIASRGDSEKHVKEGLAFFTSMGCKTVMCATRLTGKPLKAAQHFALTHLGVIPKEMSKSKDMGATAQQAANLKIAKQLVRWLKLSCR